jgi:uncharacterized protein (DUF2235 family)
MTDTHQDDVYGGAVDSPRTETSSGARGSPEARSPFAVPKKRLIVCCDGTWNDSISTDSPLTNVARISRCIPGVSDSGVIQVVSYYTGVGSGTSRASNIIDGMTGRGELSRQGFAANFASETEITLRAEQA